MAGVLESDSVHAVRGDDVIYLQVQMSRNDASEIRV